MIFTAPPQCTHSWEHAGTSVQVYDQNGGIDPFTPTLFADLTAFTGLDIMGDWTLIVEDDAFGDSGILANWNISGVTQRAAVSEPGILVLMGLGLVGLGFARRRS